EALGLGIAAVAAGAHTLLVSHDGSPFCSIRALAGDARDGELRQLLPVARLAAVALLRLELEDDQLLATEVLVDVGADAGAIDDRRADLRGAIATNHQYPVEGDLGARLVVEALDRDGVALLDAVLLTTGLDDGVRPGRGGCCLLLFT